MKMDKFAYNNDNLLLNFPSFLQKHIKNLLLNKRLTLEEFTINDITPVSSLQYLDNNGQTYSYYYNFKIPYAGKRLNWTIIFNPDDLSFAPDFDFNDEEFLYDPDINVIGDQLPSLLNWNVNNPDLLGGVLEEFLALYRKFSLDKLAKENMYSQLNSDFQKLIQNGIIDVNEVEVSVNTASVNFLINIKVDTSSLPNYLQPHADKADDQLLNPGTDKATLKVHFLKMDGSRVNASLYLSSLLEQALGSNSNLYIPSYNNKKTTFYEYVVRIQNLLKDLVDRIEKHHKSKKEFINYVCSKRSDSLVEFDAESFVKVAFLCSIEDCYVLVSIIIEDYFPETRPTVCFQLASCEDPVVLDDYPYSPRWSAEEILKRIILHLSEIVIKHNSLQQNTLQD